MKPSTKTIMATRKTVSRYLTHFELVWISKIPTGNVKKGSIDADHSHGRNVPVVIERTFVELKV